MRTTRSAHCCLSWLMNKAMSASSTQQVSVPCHSAYSQFVKRFNCMRRYVDEKLRAWTFNRSGKARQYVSKMWAKGVPKASRPDLCTLQVRSTSPLPTHPPIQLNRCASHCCSSFGRGRAGCRRKQGRITKCAAGSRANCGCRERDAGMRVSHNQMYRSFGSQGG